MEGTYRSIYKKNAQRDGCLFIKPAIHGRIYESAAGASAIIITTSIVFPV